MDEDFDPGIYKDGGEIIIYDCIGGFPGYWVRDRMEKENVSQEEAVKRFRDEGWISK